MFLNGIVKLFVVQLNFVAFLSESNILNESEENIFE